MNRIRLTAAIAIALLGLFFVAATRSEGGCHGGCVTPAGTANACDGSAFLPAGFFLMDTVTTGSDPSTNLEFYAFTLPAGEDMGSAIFAGEATVFYAASGSITFSIDTNIASRSIRVVEGTGAVAIDVTESEVVLEAGGALFVDSQAQNVTVDYRNEGNAEATLLIAAALPCLSASPTAT